MSTVVEIERAIKGLASDEREELEIRLFGHPAMDPLSAVERAGLLAAVDEADAEQGPGLSLDQMQAEVRSSFGK